MSSEISPEPPAGLPAGAVVVIAGPDGSGKSSLAAALEKATAKRPVVRLHHRARVLPARGGDTGRPVTDPYGRHPYSRALSAAKVLYYFVDYLLGWAVHIRPARSTGGVVVLERGWWDLAVDPRRYRLEGTAGLVRALARFTPQPLRVFVLEAPPEVLLTRTEDDLTVADLQAQVDAFHHVYGRRPDVVFLDATQPQAVLTEAVIAEVAAAQSRPRRWVALPRRTKARWYIPRERRSAAGGLRIYKPVTPRGLAGWRVAHAAASAGLFRWLPFTTTLPVVDVARAGPWVPPGGTVAVGLSTHAGRCHALTLDARGAPHAHIKFAVDPAGQEALEQEAAALAHIGGALEGTVRAPRLLHAEPGMLATQAVAWVPSGQPWRLPADVAHDLGTFFRSGAERNGTGRAHGDVAPWNLLRTGDGWVLVDWEAAAEAAPPFYDVLHWLVVSHALLGRPRQDELFDGLQGDGWIGDCIRAYADGAGLEATGMVSHLIDYLDATSGRCDLATATGLREDRARRSLREAAAAQV